MSRNRLKAGLLALVLAAGAGACQTLGDEGSAAVASGPAAPWATGVSNPTNGQPAFVGGTAR